MTAGGITNTIVYGNLRATNADNLLASDQTTIGYSCAPELTNGVGNITNDPLLTVEYKLGGGSPAKDAGTNQSWMLGALDLDGQVRIRYGIADMGCYEVPLLSGSVFSFH